MKIVDYQLYTFNLPLKKTLRINNKNIENRNGIVIEFTSKNGYKGYGEYAPLPGLGNQISIEEINKIKKRCDRLINIDFINIKQIFENVKWILNEKNKFRISVEFALLDLLSNESEQPIRYILDRNPGDSIKINALIDSLDKDAHEKVHDLINQGFKVFKLKVGRHNIEEEIHIVNSISRSLPEYCQLRLDANRCWKFSEAVGFINNIELQKIEYIEEPLSDYRRLPELIDETKISIALDESLYQSGYLLNNARAFVIKPFMFKSLKDVLDLVTHANKNETDVVFSDIFSSGLGVYQQLELAASLNSDTAMGFDTYRWLKSDILKNNIKFDSHVIKLNEINRELDFSKLKVILK